MQNTYLCQEHCVALKLKALKRLATSQISERKREKTERNKNNQCFIETRWLQSLPEGDRPNSALGCLCEKPIYGHEKGQRVFATRQIRNTNGFCWELHLCDIRGGAKRLLGARKCDTTSQSRVLQEQLRWVVSPRLRHCTHYPVANQVPSPQGLAHRMKYHPQGDLTERVLGDRRLFSSVPNAFVPA